MELFIYDKQQLDIVLIWIFIVQFIKSNQHAQVIVGGFFCFFFFTKLSPFTSSSWTQCRPSVNYRVHAYSICLTCYTGIDSCRLVCRYNVIVCHLYVAVSFEAFLFYFSACLAGRSCRSIRSEFIYQTIKRNEHYFKKNPTNVRRLQGRNYHWGKWGNCLTKIFVNFVFNTKHIWQ
jgi:hypothetical protein